jgi:glutamine synthetase
MAMVLEGMVIEVKHHHHEVGGPGQCEIETPMMRLLHSSNVAQMVRYVTKMVANRHSQAATFMPKPLYSEAGNGMHFHQQLFKID